MNESRVLEVRELMAKAGLTKVAVAHLLDVAESTVAGWCRVSFRPVPHDKLILLRAAAEGMILPSRQPIQPRLLERGAELAATSARPATPEDVVANLLFEHREQIGIHFLDQDTVAALELLAVQPWRWRRQMLSAVRLARPAMAIEWDGRGPFAGQRILAVAVPNKGDVFSLRVVVEDVVRQRPPAALPQKAEISSEGLGTLPAEDIAAEAAALRACGLPHDVVSKPVWWLVQIAILALAQGNLEDA